MKLAAAFAQRKDIKRKIQELQAVALRDVNIEYGKDDKRPDYDDPLETMKLIEKLSKEESELTIAINLANNRHGLMQKSNERDRYRALSLQYRQLVQGAANVRYRQENTIYETTIDIRKVAKIADDYANKARKLDLEIQELDWTVDLEEPTLEEVAESRWTQVSY